MNEQECYVTFNQTLSIYEGECPRCEENIQFNFDMEEEWNIESGYAINTSCPYCGQSLRVTLA